MRTPVHGSTPFSTCSAHEKASGSDLISQYAMTGFLLHPQAITKN
ncbi:hypothetical protein SXCC_03709 [Gluconacetobacter sp. SXCC-1]|nr:hypothetical protein SXCC_03709 [Gluconacetobacter sp. SXCC-1]